MDEADIRNNSTRSVEETVGSNYTGKEEPSYQIDFDFSLRYGDNKIVLLVRDPWVMHTFWEIRKEEEDKIKGRVRSEGDEPGKSILRLYEVRTDSGKESLEPVKDYVLEGIVDSWYVHLDEPGKKWVIDIGIISTGGRFYTLARSNRVTTPPNRMSDVTDEEWMCPEDLYYKMFAIAGGFDVGQSSLKLKKAIEKHLKEWGFSGGISSGMFGSAGLFKGKK